MARIARKNYESSYFHVIVQGYERQHIFDKNFLKEKYLKLLLDEAKNFKVELLEYCIMGNHTHFMLYCDSINQMSQYMRKVNSLYAVFYNKIKNRVGYVFRDRFLSEPIISEKHLYSCVPYIHMNPVVAGIVSKPGEYRYSSYNDFINKTGIVTDSVLVKLFGSSKDYIDLFHFMHLESGKGLEYKKDTPILGLNQAQNLINIILNDCCISNLKDQTIDIQRYFFKRFIREGITVYKIEKILKIDHKKIKRVLNI